MSPVFYLLASLLVLAQFLVPRKLAFLPILIAIAQFQNLPVLDLGVKFTATKLVVLAGILRATREHRLRWSPRDPLDLLVAIWALWAFLTAFAHESRAYNPITLRLSWIYDFFGTYLYIKAFVKDREDYVRLLKSLVIVVLPLALFALIEKTTGNNVYGSLTGFMEQAASRPGGLRAAGPFSHAILLGTFGATSLLLLIPLLTRFPSFGFAGVAACVIIVYSSGSSGPIMTLAVGLCALTIWRWRSFLPLITTALFAALVFLHLAMKDPVWYLIARIDVAGGSTGYHRARLISAALEHFDRWWLLGTDYTRDWIPYGVAWDTDEADITNYYLRMGVAGGVFLLILFVSILFMTFRAIGRKMRTLRETGDPDEFLLWTAGVALFAHAATFISVSYFDQTYATYCLIVASVSALCADRSLPLEASFVDGELSEPRHDPERIEVFSIISPRRPA